MLPRPVEGKFQPRPGQFTAAKLTAQSDGGARQLTLERVEAEAASERFRKRLLRYGMKNGLPNMSAMQCIEELRLLDRILDDDLALADKIKAEINRPSMLKEGEW